MAPYSSQIASSRLLAVTDRCTCLVCVHAVLVVLLCSSLLYLLMQHTRSKRIVYAVQVFAALYITFTGLYLVHLDGTGPATSVAVIYMGSSIWLSRSSYFIWEGPGRPATQICLPWLPCDAYRPVWSESLPALLRCKGKVEAKYANPI